MEHIPLEIKNIIEYIPFVIILVIILVAVLTWDIFMQDYRLVPAESVDVVSVIPTTPPEEFWKYFSEVLSRMSGTDKEQFMDK